MLWWDLRIISKRLAQALVLVSTIYASQAEASQSLQRQQPANAERVAILKEMKLVKQSLANIRGLKEAIEKADEAIKRGDVQNAQDWIITAKGYLEKLKSSEKKAQEGKLVSGTEQVIKGLERRLDGIKELDRLVLELRQRIQTTIEKIQKVRKAAENK